MYKSIILAIILLLLVIDYISLYTIVGLIFISMFTIVIIAYTIYNTVLLLDNDD